MYFFVCVFESLVSMYVVVDGRLLCALESDASLEVVVQVASVVFVQCDRCILHTHIRDFSWQMRLDSLTNEVIDACS